METTIDINLIPQFQKDAMCRVLQSCISRAFSDPAVQEDYERWKAERETENPA